MSSKMKTTLVIVLAPLASSAWAVDQGNACMVAALIDYNQANLALLTKSDLPKTVEATIAQRRLQEQYCLRFAQCQLASLPPQQTTMALDGAFSDCLRDEAMEKYQLAPSTGN
ncbi:hypothetical protein QEV83_01570 [Methylocapsa sp. D3K7]|uniref:hypothetical protein n=1 Tax=Methylocapsa sp. D3K7 TaxID=3041435 RepID=UPI00244EB8C3|nr:hypothetical protein [Methylocapsa sp. D3K7]WGJ15025.1 hypothetical protein QEV83_01570 [Methylocapsa sp. D3K7]